MPQQMHREEELRVDRLTNQPQARFLEGPVALEQVALEARGDDVRPRRLSPARARDDMVHRQLLAAPAAVLAGVARPAQEVLLVERHPLEQRLADVHRPAGGGRQGESPPRGGEDAGGRFAGLPLRAPEAGGWIAWRAL